MAHRKLNSNRLIVGVAVLVVFVSTFYIAKGRLGEKETRSNSSKLQITASFYPLYFFTEQIGGDLVHVSNITPAGAEPHDYEPTTNDIAQIEESRLLVINGRLEPWSDKVADLLKNKNIHIVKAAEGLTTLQFDEDGEKQQDPHVWLDPVLAKEETKRIMDGITSSDSDMSHLLQYADNERSLQQKLDQLDLEFKNGLANCKQKNIVTSHAAFGYLAKRYGLTQVAISGISPDAEPSPRGVAKVSDFVRKNKVKYIFFETLVSPRLADTIASETGAKTLVFNPLEGLTEEEEQSGENYFTVQRENLKNLRIALECN